MKVPGVEKIVVIDGTPPPAKFQPVGGVAVVAANTWAAIKGRDALVVHWDDGPHGAYDSAAYKTQLARDCRQTRQDGAQRWRRRTGARLGGKDDFRRVLRSGAGARVDGAAERHCSCRRRKGRSVGAGAEPGRSPRRARAKIRAQARERDRQRHAVGRRVRPQVEMRLCARSRVGVARDGRRPGQAGVDPRRRSAQRLFSRGLVRAPRCRHRRPGQGRCLAASRRRADDPVDLCRRPKARAGGSN